LEYISGGSIHNIIQKYGQLDEKLIQIYTAQILCGLEYLHINNIIHKDIKGGNILVDDKGICKLSDFGNAKRIY